MSMIGVQVQFAGSTAATACDHIAKQEVTEAIQAHRAIIGGIFRVIREARK